MVVPELPPIHLTARAAEWLRSATEVYPGSKFYKVPVSEAACDEFHPDRMVAQYVRAGHKYLDAPMDPRWAKREKLYQEWSCTTEDIRAYWLSLVVHPSLYDFTIRFDPGRLKYRMVNIPPLLPTCSECGVIMDRDAGKTMKYGKYINKDLDWVIHTKLCHHCQGQGTVKMNMMEAQFVLLGADNAIEAQPAANGHYTVTFNCPKCRPAIKVYRGGKAAVLELARSWARQGIHGTLEDAKLYLAGVASAKGYQDHYDKEE